MKTAPLKPSIHGSTNGLATGKPLPEACAEAALQPIDDADAAISIANSAVHQWNSGRGDEVRSARRLQSDNIQQQMADELFDAIMEHLNIIPRPVKDKVIARFKAIPDKMITVVAG